MSNLAVFGFDGQDIRFVDGNPMAIDLAKVLGYSDPGKIEEGDCYTVFDLLAIAVEIGFSGKIKESEKIFQFVKTSGMIKCATTERLYHACRIHQAWVENGLSKESTSNPEVYLVGVKKNKTLKIGFSTRIEKRIEALQVSSPYPIELISRIKGSITLEKKLQKEFSHLRLSGEWFKWSDEIIQKFRRLESI